MDELLNEINPNDIVVDTSNIINRDDCSIELPEIGRRAYINSAKGRAAIKADCEQTNSPEVYTEVMAVWGDAPTVEDEAPPEPTFDEMKTVKIDELSSSFTARVSGSFVCSRGWPMQFDRSDTLAVEGAIQLLRATGQTSGYLTDAEDVTHYDVSIGIMEAVKVEMLATYAACHARKQELRAAINAAQTKDDLDAVQIVWPI